MDGTVITPFRMHFCCDKNKALLSHISPTRVSSLSRTHVLGAKGQVVMIGHTLNSVDTAPGAATAALHRVPTALRHDVSLIERRCVLKS